MRKLLSIIAGVAAVATIVASCVTIFDWLNKPRSELKAFVSYSEYKTPETFLNFPKEIADALTYDVIKSHIVNKFKISSKDSEEIVSEAIYEASNYIRNTLVEKSISYEITGLSGYVSVDIVNTGTKTLQNVKVTVPEVAARSIYRDGKKPEFKISSEPICLGDLNPLEHAKVICWTRIPLRTYSAEDIHITHNEGIGNVITKISIDDNSSIYYLYKLGWFGLFQIIFIATLVLSIIQSAYKKYKETKQQ